MTDNEIIKALEWYTTVATTINSATISKSELLEICNLMNRLKTKRDELYQENLELKDGYFQKRYEDIEHQELMGLRNAWRNEAMRNVDLQAEIENLKAEKDNLIRTYKECQIENLKDFADQIKLAFYYHFDELIPSAMSDEIDKILKEMEGESK